MMAGHCWHCTALFTVTVLLCLVGSAAFSNVFKLPAGSGHSRVPVVSRGGAPRLQRGLGLRMEISDEMRKRLKKENEAPLRFPLLWMGAVVFGKGLTDAMITVIKSSMGTVVLSEQTTMLGIDVLCVVAGTAILLRASDMWTGCAYNPTCWSLGKPWFLLKDGEGAK